MKKFPVLLALLFACFFLPAQSKVRALFLGNSYTNVNNLPVLVKNLALSAGDTLEHASNTPGGYTLEGHSTNASSLGLIAQGNWDYVVLQEQSQLPSFSPNQVASQVLPFAAQLVDSIRAANHCTEPVFYMTWGRKNGDASNCGFYPPVCTYAGMQDRLRSSYMLMANQNQSTVAPVGSAWWQAILQNSALELYSSDQSHPSFSGSYLAACVFYGTFFQKSPQGLSYRGSLDSATAAFLQDVAHTVVFDSLSQWRIGANEVAAGFSYSLLGNGDANFSNLSQSGSTAAFLSYEWDFGDGGLSSAANPTHNYAANGQYVVQLVVDDGCRRDTVRDTLQVTIVGRAVATLRGFDIYPNPNGGRFWLDLSGFIAAEMETPLRLELWNAAGDLLLEREMTSGAGQEKVLFDGGELPAGIYFLRAVAAGKYWTEKLLVD